MTSLPRFANWDRALGAVRLVGLGVVQAFAFAVAAFATRAAFGALHGGTPLPWLALCALAASGLLAATCHFVSRRQAEALGQSYAIALRRALYAKIARLPKSRHERRRVGALSLRFVGDLSAARLWFGRGLPDVLTACVVLPGAVSILHLLSPQLALAGLLPLLGGLALMAAVAWHLQRAHRTLRKNRANIAIAMIERIAIAPELDLMGRTDRELRALDAQGETLRNEAVARRGRTAGLQAILQASGALAGLSVLWLGARIGAEPADVAACLSVLALVAVPLQDLGAAWDKFCAWTIAREKALRLLSEAEVQRPVQRRNEAPSVSVRGRLAGREVEVIAKAGNVTRLTTPQAASLARAIAGLDHNEDLTVRFDGAALRPRLAFIGETHVGLQGSLRRSATLSAEKRPDDARITEVLTAFGLDALLADPKGLGQRLAENGKGMSQAQTLRLDLARAVLGEAEVIVIASLRFAADRARAQLLCRLQQLCPATIILACPAPHGHEMTLTTP